MAEYMTTLWENIKGRINYLEKSIGMELPHMAAAQAITEEMEILHKRIDELEKKK